MTRLLAPLLLLFALATTAAAQDCADRTGYYASLIIDAPETRGIAPGDVVSVTGLGGVRCHGQATAPEGNMAVPVWADNIITADTDGARDGDLLAMAVSRGNDLLYTTPLGASYADDLVFIAPPYPLDSLAAALADLESVVDSVQLANAGLSADNAALQDEVSTLSANLAALTQQSAESIAAYQDSLSTERAALAAAQDEIASLEDQLANSPSEQEIQARIDAAVAAAVQAERRDLARAILRLIANLRGGPGQ